MQDSAAGRVDEKEPEGLDAERLPCRRCGDPVPAGADRCSACGFAPRQRLVALGVGANVVGFGLSLAGVGTAVGAPVALLGVLVIGFALIARPSATDRPDGDGDPWYSWLR